MELAADESVDAPIVEALRRRGYIVFSIAEQMAGATDKQVLEFANSSRVLLLTGDKDVGELVFRQRLLSVGVVLVRLAQSLVEPDLQALREDLTYENVPRGIRLKAAITVLDRAGFGPSQAEHYATTDRAGRAGPWEQGLPSLAAGTPRP